MRRRTLSVLFVLAIVGTAQPAAAQQRPGTLLNFQDTDIAFVLSALAQAAGIGFSYSDLPAKPITLRTTEPLTREQMISLIRSIAESNGIRMTESDGMIRLQGSGAVAEQEDPRQLYIHRLRHARAPVLAQTLQALFSGGPISGNVTGSGSQTLTQRLNQLQQQAQQQVVRAPQVVLSAGNVSIVGGTTIVPDDATNSLLVRATPADWLVMQQAIEALDLRPLQVVIEVIIAEVRRTEDLDVGVSVTADGSRDGRTTIGDLPSTAGEQDFTLRIVRSGDIDIQATLSALAASGNVRVLSRPIILAQNNQEASIAVGQQRPFVQVSRGVGNVPGQPFSEDVVQYRDVATELTILPTINEDGYVNLAVTQEVNTATSEVQFGAPVISTRSAVTQILARNGQTVVLGGLIERQQDRSRGGIPFLKDIPIIGALFGNTRHNDVDAELFLFLTPHIVAEDADADRVKEELERNADLLQPLTPIRPLIPPGTTSGTRPPPQP